jgi:two-component system, OmpR family, sensor histidine kinase KdpD
MTRTVDSRVRTVDSRWRRARAVGRRIRGLVPSLVVIGSALVAGAVVIGALEAYGLNDASPAYLLAVVAVAVLRGTGPAVATAVGAFLVYDFFYVEPIHTFTVRDPAEWLNLLLLLVVGVVVGRLAGQERDRAVAAIEGEREASAMFNISFTLASRRDTASALGPIAGLVRDEVRASRVWIVVGDMVVADTTDQARVPTSAVVYTVLRRRPGDEPAEWVRVHAPTRAPKSVQDPAEQSYQVVITAGGRTYGAVWVARPRGFGPPDLGETRVLAAAADQIGGSLERDRLQRDATSAEVSRRSDALKSALLDSVSHDLRTPLASIRAAAGTLMDPEVEWPPDQRREIAGSIDLEAEWLNRLVTNLLDMSRVEAGELRPSLGVFSLTDLIAEAVRRSAPSLAGHAVDVRVPPDLPPVLVDEVFIGQVLANTLDNAAKYGGPGAPIRVSARVTDQRVGVVVEDGGAGVPPDALPRLFEKFYRVPRKGEGSRRGTGIGLAVVRGLVEAMGGRVEARASDLGGLAVELDLPIATAPPGETDDATNATRP